MAGWGDIGGGCTVKFKVDKRRAGDRRQRWSVVDGVARKKGHKKLTITFPRAVRRRARGNQVTLTLTKGKHLRVRWN